MARGKHSTPETAGEVKDVMLADVEQKAKTTSAKVTLVKPVQATEIQETVMNTVSEETIEDSRSAANSAAEGSEEAVSTSKQKPRPKVGRSATARKKKSEAGQGTEKKEPKSTKRKVKADAAGEKAADTEAEKPLDTVVTVSSYTASISEHQPVLSLGETSQTEQVPAAELTPDWDTVSRSRPWDIKFTLFLLALFAAVNLGLVYLLNDNNHKAKALIQDAATALNHSSTPAEQPAASAETAKTASAAAPLSADAVTPLPPRPAVVPVAEDAPKETAPAATPPTAATPAQTAAAAPAQAPAATVPAAASAPVMASNTPAASTATTDTVTTAAQEKANSQLELLSILSKN